MRILVAIANYGAGNQQYLQRLIAEYRAMPWNITITVLSNIPKDVAPDVEVVVGLPDPRNPWSLPFLHRRLFAERRDAYDLFIYSEDDTLVTVRNIEAFMDAARVLQAGEIAGFLRTETDTAGNVYVSTMHNFFRWVPSRMATRGGELFAPFSNDHAACYMVTREQLTRAIESGGFLVEPHVGRYDMLCAAATDIYTQCGLQRLIRVSRLSDFLLPHLPNKYIGIMGVPLTEVLAQVAALQGVADGQWKGPLLDVESTLVEARLSKNLYERPDPDVMRIIPPATANLLSVACGWGETEAALAGRGIDVTAIPVDPVFGDAVRRRGVRTLDGPLKEALGLAGRRFDCILLADALHLVEEPVEWLQMLRALLVPESGRLVLSVPNTPGVSLRASRREDAAARYFKERGVNPTGARGLKALLKRGGFRAECIVPVLGPARERIASAMLGVLRPVLARRFVVRAVSAR